MVAIPYCTYIMKLVADYGLAMMDCGLNAEAPMYEELRQKMTEKREALINYMMDSDAEIARLTTITNGKCGACGCDLNAQGDGNALSR